MPPISVLWPVLLGGVIGVVVGILASTRRGREPTIRRTLARAATVAATASVGALAGAWGLWIADGRPVWDLYVHPEAGMQFLSNEQFNMFMVGRLAWALPAIAVVAGVVAAGAWFAERTPRRRNGG